MAVERRAGARVRRLTSRSIAAAALLTRRQLVNLPCTHRCSNLLVQDHTATLMMILPALSLAVVLIIPSHFALLPQVKNLQKIQHLR